MRQPTMTDTCVFVFYHARDQGDNPCPDDVCVRFFFPLHMYIVFSRVPVPTVSLKNPVHGSDRRFSRSPRVSSENSAERDWVFFFFNLSKRLRGSVPARVRNVILSDLATDWARNLASR